MNKPPAMGASEGPWFPVLPWSGGGGGGASCEKSSELKLNTEIIIN